MEKLRITQIKSGIGKPKKQKLTLQALGIKKLHNPVEVIATPQIKGMIEKVRHLVIIEEVK